MKKGLLFFLLLISFQNSFSQKIRFTDSTNEWWQYYGWLNSGIPNSYSFTYKYIGDTTINGFQYKVSQFGFIREDTVLKKVYGLDLKCEPGVTNVLSDTELVLYDYNLNVGDTVTFVTKHDSLVHYVKSIDSTQINGLWYKVWEMFPIYSTVKHYVIEGIGSTGGPWYSARANEFEGKHRLSCFYNNSAKPIPLPVFDYFDNIKSCLMSVDNVQESKRISVFPNPVKFSTTIQFDNLRSEKFSFTVYNIYGQVVFQKVNIVSSKIDFNRNGLPAGLYCFRLSNSNNKVYTGKVIIED